LFVVVWVTSACCPTGVTAQTASVRWSLKAGTEFYVVETLQRTHSLQITREGESQKPGDDTRNESRTVYSRVRILTINDKHETDLELTLLDIRDPSDQSTFLGKRLRNVSFRVRLNAAGQVQQFEGYDALVTRVSAGNQQFARMFKSMLSRETLEQMFVEFLQMAPSAEEPNATEWTREFDVSLGPLGTMAVTKQFKISGVENHLDREMIKVQFSGAAKYSEPAESHDNLNFKIESGELTVRQLSGTAWFDPQQESLVELQSSFEIGGEFAMRVGDDKAKVSLSQKEQTRIQILESTPLSK